MSSKVKLQTEEGITPLMFAAEQNNDPEVVKALINAGADINALDVDGWNALINAALNTENPRVILTLLNAGADGKLKSFTRLSTIFSTTWKNLV